MDLLLRMETDWGFWNNAKLQRDEIEKIIQHDTLKQKWVDSDIETTVRKSLLDIGRLISQATDSHEQMIFTTMTHDDISGAVYKDRGKSFLAWNGGFRVFASSIRREFAELSSVRYALDDILTLEIGWMDIGTPHSAIFVDGPERDEMNKLQLAFSGAQLATPTSQTIARRYSIEIIVDDGCYLFAQYCAEIVAVSSEQVTNATAQNQRVMKSRVKKLSAFQKGVGPEWRETISAWKGRAK